MELQATASALWLGVMAPQLLAHGAFVSPADLGPVLHTEPCLEQAGCVPASSNGSAAVLSIAPQASWRSPPLPSAQQEPALGGVRASKELSTRPGTSI